jgi:hypothetical protein
MTSSASSMPITSGGALGSTPVPNWNSDSSAVMGKVYALAGAMGTVLVLV